MLELNSWFFVLLVNFLVLLYVMNLVLFRPLLKIFKEREDNTTGAIEAAKAMEAEKERFIEEMKKELSEVAQRARETFEAMRAEGLGKQKELLSIASEEASGMIEKAKGDLKAEAERARAALRTDVQRFSDEIVNKLVGA